MNFFTEIVFLLGKCPAINVHLKQSAKLSYILAVERSVDPELRHSILASSPDVSSTVLGSLSAAKPSVASIHSATFKNHACHYLHSTHVDYWESSFEPSN